MTRWTLNINGDIRIRGEGGVVGVADCGYLVSDDGLLVGEVGLDNGAGFDIINGTADRGVVQHLVETDTLIHSMIIPCLDVDHQNRHGYQSHYHKQYY